MIPISPEEIGNPQGANGNSPRRREIKLRKNEMTLRKKEIKVPKNSLFLPGDSKILPEGMGDFFDQRSRRYRRDRSYRTSNGCRDARKCLVGGRPLCQRLQRPLVLTGTDAQIVRPYSRYTSRRLRSDARLVRFAELRCWGVCCYLL